MRILLSILLMAGLTACEPKPTAETGLVQFTLTGDKPKAGTLVEARLVEISAPDRRSIATKQFAAGDAYLLPYPKDAILPSMQYAIQIAVLNGGHQVAVSEQAGPVLTNGHGDKVDIRLVAMPPAN